MEKKDLKNGMIVEFRNGERGIVIDEWIICELGFLGLASVKSNLTIDNENHSHDIMKVFVAPYPGQIIRIFTKEMARSPMWERKSGYDEGYKQGWDDALKAISKIVLPEGKGEA